IQEAIHVFIKNGLELFSGKVAIMEVGFGTGLNAFITFLKTTEKSFQVEYTGVEAYPVSDIEIAAMNYPEQLAAGDFKQVFSAMHSAEWEVTNEISKNFKLLKRRQFFQEIS